MTTLNKSTYILFWKKKSYFSIKALLSGASSVNYRFTKLKILFRSFRILETLEKPFIGQ